jgi:hypothetical protein
LENGRGQRRDWKETLVERRAWVPVGEEFRSLKSNRD